MSDPQQTEYDVVHAQVRERKAELKAKEIPGKLKALITTVRNNREHPLLREVVSASEDQASFIFNDNLYSIEFRKGSAFSVPTGSRLCSGILTARANSDVVLKSSFEATEDEWGWEFYYKDTAIFRRGNWVDELLKLKHESDELRRAQERAYFQSKEQLASLRDRFALPESIPAAPVVACVPRQTKQQSEPTRSASSAGATADALRRFVRRTLGL